MTRLSFPEKLSQIQRDPLLTAKTAGLRYVSDTSPGWYRRRRGQTFYYVDAGGKKCRDAAVLERIRKLALPPAWENVWICSDENGHLQATGNDARGRKQYRYHPAWNALRSQTKYFRLPQFAEALPAIRAQLDADLKLPGTPREKVLALAVRIMEQTNIRIGNEVYKNLYGSFGLTTLQDHHNKAIDLVAEQLGNTRAVCKKYYIHPAILTAYEKGELDACQSIKKQEGIDLDRLPEEEKMVQCLLREFAWD